MAANDASRGNPPEDALSATQPAASFADEGFALLPAAFGSNQRYQVSICGRGRRETVSVREMRYASSLEAPFCSLRKPSMLFADINLLDADFAIKHHQWVGCATAESPISARCLLRPMWLPPSARPTMARGTPAHARALQRPCPCSHDASARLAAENLPLQRWLEEKCSPFEAKMTAEDCYWGTVLACAEMARFGVVSFSDMYYATEERARVVPEAGMKANMCEGLVAFEEKPYAEYPICAQMEALVRDWHWGRRRTHLHRL